MWWRRLFESKKREEPQHEIVQLQPKEEQQGSSIEQTQQVIDNARRLVNELKWKEAAPQILPIAEQYLREIQTINNNLEQGNTPEHLESCKEQLLVLLQWFVKQEQEYPDAPWLIHGTAIAMLPKVRNRYNERIYDLAKRFYGKEVIGFIDKQAENYIQVEDAIKQELEFDSENTRRLRCALYLGK